MWPTVFNPFEELREIEKRLSNVIDTARPKNQEVFAPVVNEKITDKAYIVEVDLPGVKKEDIDVSVNDGVLVISGERKIEKKEESEKYTRIESFFGKFERAFKLPPDADAENIKAKYENGVLRIELPRAQKLQGKKITIE